MVKETFDMPHHIPILFIVIRDVLLPLIWYFLRFLRSRFILHTLFNILFFFFSRWNLKVCERFQFHQIAFEKIVDMSGIRHLRPASA